MFDVSLYYELLRIGKCTILFSDFKLKEFELYYEMVAQKGISK